MHLLPCRFCHPKIAAWKAETHAVGCASAGWERRRNTPACACFEGCVLPDRAGQLMLSMVNIATLNKF